MIKFLENYDPIMTFTPIKYKKLNSLFKQQITLTALISDSISQSIVEDIKGSPLFLLIVEDISRKSLV